MIRDRDKDRGATANMPNMADTDAEPPPARVAEPVAPRERTRRAAPRNLAALRALAAREDIPGYLSRWRQRLVASWQGVGRWVRANTFAPPWLPAEWQRPEVGYLAAAFLTVLAIGATWRLDVMLPTFPFQGVVELLAVVVVALNFGAGPSLLATFLGALLLDYVALKPYFAWSPRSGPQVAGVLLFFVVGCIVSVLPSQTERARRRTEALADEAEQARGEAERARARAEALVASLAAERSRLEAVFEALPERITLFDAHGTITRFNTAAQRNAGPDRGHAPLAEVQQVYDVRTITGEPFPAEDLPLARALRGEIVRGAEMRVRDAEGRDQLILGSAAPFYDEGGQMQGVVGTAHDITALRQAEAEAALRARQLDATFEAMTDGVIIFDGAGRLVRMNRAAADLLGITTPRAYSLPTGSGRISRSGVRDEVGRPLARDGWPISRVLRGEVLTGADAVDVRVPAVDGGEMQLSVTGAPFRDRAGQIDGAICVFRDVTERRQLERRTKDALDAVLAMAVTLVELPHDLPPSSDETSEAREVVGTERAIAQRLAALTCEVLGCTRVGITAIEPEQERLRAIAVVGLPPEQERQWWAEQRALEARQTRLGEGADPAELARFRAGEVFLVDMTQPPYRDLPNPYGVTTTLVAPMRTGETLVGMLSLDYGGPPHAFTAEETRLAGAVAQLGAVVLERERLLRERAQSQASLLALRETNRRMNEFLGIASHELKTPLTTLKANAQIMERRVRRMTGEIQQIDREVRDRLVPLVDPLRQLTEHMTRATERQERLIGDLVDVSRIQAGQLELRPDDCDLAALVRECVEEQRLHLRERTITLTVPDAAVHIHADPDRIGQVVTNYLTNALKYSPQDQAVSVEVRRERGGARVSVHDEGPGVSPEDQERLWDRFYRVPGVEVQSGSGVGLGLGLHICKTLIERHGGQVGIESQPGCGATFWFTLPLAPAP